MIWLEPWYPVTDAGQVATLEAQLRNEIAPGHVLERQRFQLIARRSGTDDVLVLISDGRVAEVHMTWRRSRETGSRWPATVILPSLEDWARDLMVPPNEEHSPLD
jgi:hypothetical protein